MKSGSASTYITFNLHTITFFLPLAPKTYSLANTAQVDTGGASDKSILKVSHLFTD